MATLSKGDLEAQLREEKKDIERGRLKEDTPLDLSENFQKLCHACRQGDLKVCQEMILAGASINAVDAFDYTPLILASLCGHYEVVRLLLESGALCERDTFQGERALYNALTIKIRNLLLQYDYSKNADPLQPLAAHISSLLTKHQPQTSDIVLNTTTTSLKLHKFILAIRSPFFKRKLSVSPETSAFRLPSNIPAESLAIAVRFLYLGDLPSEITVPLHSRFTENDILIGVDKLSRLLELPEMWDRLIEGGDRRQARQKRADDVSFARDQIQAWLHDKIFKHKIVIDSDKVDSLRFAGVNGVFADVLLSAEQEEADELEILQYDGHENNRNLGEDHRGLPIGPFATINRLDAPVRAVRTSTLYPVHRAILIRSEYFHTMFTSSFQEAILPIPESVLQVIKVNCGSDTLETILTYLYTERIDIPLELSFELLVTADELLIDVLKTKAAVAISTLGSKGSFDQPKDGSDGSESDRRSLSIFDVVRAGWLTRVPRLEDFGAKYIADRLEDYIDVAEFEDIIRESAHRVVARQETDTIELLDEIRYYLGERFRLRFENIGREAMMDEEASPDRDTIMSPFTNFPQLDDGDDNRDDDAFMATPQDTGPLLESAGIMADQKGLGIGQADKGFSMAGVRTADSELAGDEFATHAFDYEILLDKIDRLLERLRLDA